MPANSEADNTAAISPEPTNANRPQLSLQHFFLLTATAAFVLFAYTRGGAQFSLNPKPIFWKLLFGFVNVAPSIYWIYLALMLRLSLRTIPRIVEHPGHLIIAVLGATTFLMMAATISSEPGEAIVSGNVPNAQAWTWILASSFLALLAAGMSLTGIWLYRWYWKIAFGLLTLSFLNHCAIALQFLPTEGQRTLDWYEFLTKFRVSTNLLVPTAILICLVIDCCSTKKRTSWHWAGTIGYLAWLAVGIIFQAIVVRYLPVDELYSVY